MRRNLLASIGGAFAIGLLAASAQATPGQFGAVEKSVATQNNLLTLIGGGHGGGGHGGGGHGGGGHGGGHMGGGHFGGLHHGGHFAGGHAHGFHHGHFRGFGLWGWPYYWGAPYYAYSNCWWSPRYHRRICPRYW